MAGKENNVKNVINSAVNLSSESGVGGGVTLTNFLVGLSMSIILFIFIIIAINVIFDTVKQMKEDGEGFREISKSVVYSIIAIVGVLSFMMMVRF